MLSLRDSYDKKGREWAKFGSRAYITPKLYSQGMKHFVTQLTDKCWFSKQPHIIILTVAEAIIKYPNYILWCYKNLNVRWAITTEKTIIQIQYDIDNSAHITKFKTVMRDDDFSVDFPIKLSNTLHTVKCTYKNVETVLLFSSGKKAEEISKYFAQYRLYNH